MSAVTERNPQRHVYLPGIGANDAHHVRAASMELRADKEYWSGRGDKDFTPGFIFVEKQDHIGQVQAHLQTRKQAIEAKPLGNRSQGELRELAGIEHALTAGNIRTLSDPLPAQTQPRGGTRDKLYVKGHGNAGNANYITARNTTSDELTTQGPSTFGAPGGGVDWHSPGVLLNEQHTAQRVATNVLAIGKTLDTNSLDVRITSCGGGGSFGVDAQDAVTETPADQTFAGSVKAQIEARKGAAGQAGFTPVVHGYQGDTNRTFIAKYGTDKYGYDRFGFHTAIKLGAHKTDAIPSAADRTHFDAIKQHMTGKVQAVDPHTPIKTSTPPLTLGADPQTTRVLNKMTNTQVGRLPDVVGEPRKASARRWNRPEPTGTQDNVMLVRRSHARRQV
ncbi:MAG: hypothetical protein H6981_02930 [Gammaproteobacteria bacterium]|nr:hypothetical protein [Gammaproteobacteria bacterium]MCP5135743.1 hypothetical protein [Gammaproteobacteria bacterium]